MRTFFLGPLPWLIGAAFLLLIFIFQWLYGSVIVIDETHGVKSAVITNSEGVEQNLLHIWSRIFVTVPFLEGTIEIRCANDMKKRQGYVTGHLHTKLRVVGRTPCEHLVEAD